MRLRDTRRVLVRDAVDVLAWHIFERADKTQQPITMAQRMESVARSTPDFQVISISCVRYGGLPALEDRVPVLCGITPPRCRSSPYGELRGRFTACDFAPFGYLKTTIATIAQ